MSSSILSTQVSTTSGASSSLELDSSHGSTSATVAKQPVQDIKPTTVGSVSTGYKTKTLKQEVLQPSFEATGSSSSQFAMQHATQALPSNSVTMATTSYTSETPKADQNVKSSSKMLDSGATVSSKLSDSSDTSFVSIAMKTSSVPKSVHPSKTVPKVIAATKDMKDGLDTANSATDVDSESSKYEPVVSETISPTVSQSAGQTVSIGLTPSSSVTIDSQGSSVKSAAVTMGYGASSRDLYHTVTPSKTEFSSAVLDRMSLKTTPLASLTITPSVKPMTTDSGTSTPLFGGGPNDILLYVAVPLCGVGLLIFLIVCIVCIKRRKAKQKGSPARRPVPDLWVNTNAEVPLTPIDPRRDIGINGGETLGGQRLSALRKRKKSKFKDGDHHMVSSNQKEAENCHMTNRDRNEAEICHMIGRPQKEIDRSLIVTDIQGKDVCLIGDDIDDVSSADDGLYDENDNKDIAACSRHDPGGGCVTYEAVFDFPGELDTHLPLRQGDVVHVHRKEDNGWWRGTLGDKTGWFPNNYVQAVLHDYLEEENEVEAHNELNISSFMVKKVDESNRHSYPTEEDIKSEPIYCKIQSKSKRKSEPKCEEKSPYKYPPQVTREDTPIPIDEGTRFVALYAYTAQLKGELTLEQGDVLLGKERDRNGWMHGVRESTGQEGWFPAVYVDEIIEKEEKPLPADIDTKTETEPDPAAYEHLEVNTKLDSDKDWVGILHKAIHTFTGEKAGDLCFNEGDTVTVFQVLENGWWLGSKDDIVGWFPRSYVEMLGHQSPKPKYDVPAIAETPTDTEPTVINKDKSNPGKLRPARKAPAPPDSSASPTSESKIPKMARPNRKAPPPPVTPTKEAETENIEQDHDPLYDVIGKKPEEDGNVKTEQVDDNKNDVKTKSGIPLIKSGIPLKTQGEKQKVRMRYIKPKLVSVPRNSVNLSDFHFEKEHSRKHITRPKAPPPPRPSPPNRITQDKLTPETVNVPQNNFEPKTDDVDTMDHKLSDNEETESFFNVSPQRKFDSHLKRQDSGDVDDTQPYKSFSSFGSTFGKREADAPPNVGVSKTPTITKQTGIPKLARQIVVEDDLSPTKNNVVHEELKTKERAEFEPLDNKPNVSVEEKLTDLNENSRKDDSLLNDYDIIKTPERDENSKLDLSECSSFLEITDTPVSENQNKAQSDTKATAHNVSRIPRLPGNDSISKLPLSHNAKQKSDSNDNKKDLPNDNSEVITDKFDSEIRTNERHVNSENDKSVDKTTEHDNASKSETVVKAVNGDIGDIERPRTNSMDKPPVAPKPKASALPKVLPKPKSVTPEKKGPENVHDAEHYKEEMPKSETIVKSPSPETVESSKKPPEHAKVSKIPHGSKIAQKSPGLKGKASKIPASPKVGRKIVESKEYTESQNEINTENETQGPRETKSETVNLKHKPESPVGTRKIPRHRTFSNENPSLRNRSNSPSGRTGIPSPSVRNRSNSPAAKPIKPSSIPSPSGIPSLSAKPTALPKKQIKQDSLEKGEKSEPNSPITSKPVNDITEAHSSDELESGEARPSRPSKPPRVQKQKSADSKIPKQGKSLLPVIHKSMDSGSPSGGGSGKAKSGIPMTKPPRPPQPKAAAQHQENGTSSKKTLYQAVKGYTAQCDGELTFSEGTFIKELSDCDRPGWFVGMLADGTTGIYPADHLKPSPVSAQSEA